MNNKPKNEVFIFRYDPHSSFESMFEEFWEAVDGKLEKVEPHIVRSNSIEALSTNMTKNRLRLFATLVEKKPANLTELAHLLQKDNDKGIGNGGIFAIIGVVSVLLIASVVVVKKQLSKKGR